MTLSDEQAARLSRLTLAEEVLRAASAETMRYFRQAPSVETKADQSPVTIADQRTEAIIRDAITKAFPDDGFIGEETGQSGNSERFWIVDPIDGTRAFIHGNPLFGCLIGYMEQGLPVLGACALPAMNDVWLGLKGSPATLNGAPITTSRCERLEEAAFLTTSPDLFQGTNLEQLQTLKSLVARTQYGGDCFNYLSLASGWADLVIEVGLQPYDILPLVPIIEAAGGLITGFNGLPVGHGNYSQVIAAATPALHEAALSMFKA